MKKILIVEDDNAIRLGLEQILEAESYSTLVSADGVEGFNRAIKESPDLILLDLNLPKLNGLDVCRKLRENNFENPILIITSKSDQIDKIVGLEVGADDYITKPFNNREIISRVRAHLRLADRIKKSLSNFKTFHSKKNGERKLLAIFFSDMKDYSKKMNEDEEAALELLSIHNKLIKTELEKEGGRIVEIIGDAFLAAFNSCVNAVVCGLNIQQRFSGYNLGKPINEQIEVRIGIHLGEVIDYGDNLKGDAINIAARIQQSASTGAVFISENVYKVIFNKLKADYHYLGEHNLKNIKENISMYKVLNHD